MGMGAPFTRNVAVCQLEQVMRREMEGLIDGQ